MNVDQNGFVNRNVLGGYVRKTQDLGMSIFLLSAFTATLLLFAYNLVFTARLRRHFLLTYLTCTLFIMYRIVVYSIRIFICVYNRKNTSLVLALYAVHETLLLLQSAFLSLPLFQLLVRFTLAPTDCSNKTQGPGPLSGIRRCRVFLFYMMRALLMGNVCMAALSGSGIMLNTAMHSVPRLVLEANQLIFILICLTIAVEKQYEKPRPRRSEQFSIILGISLSSMVCSIYSIVMCVVRYDPGAAYTKATFYLFYGVLELVMINFFISEITYRVFYTVDDIYNLDHYQAAGLCPNGLKATVSESPSALDASVAGSSAPATATSDSTPLPTTHASSEDLEILNMKHAYGYEIDLNVGNDANLINGLLDTSSYQIELPESYRTPAYANARDQAAQSEAGAPTEYSYMHPPPTELRGPPTEYLNPPSERSYMQPPPM